MTDEDYARKLGEVDRVLNDPDLPIQPALIWRLLAEISAHESQPAQKLAANPHSGVSRKQVGWRPDQM